MLSLHVRRYKAIVKYKTAYYSFYLPVALAMHMVSSHIMTVLLGSMYACKFIPVSNIFILLHRDSCFDLYIAM